MTTETIQIKGTEIPDGVLDLVEQLPNPEGVKADTKFKPQFLGEQYVYNTGLTLLSTWRAALPSSVTVEVDDSSCRVTAERMLRNTGFKEIMAQGAAAQLASFEVPGRAPLQPILATSTTEKSIASIARLRDSAAPNLRPRTLASYQMIVKKHLKPEIGSVQLAKLTPETIQRYMNGKRASGLSARTIQYHHAVLRRALGQAERWGKVQRNVARLVSPPKVERQEVRPLTPDQARILLDAISEDRMACLYALAIGLGLRPPALRSRVPPRPSRRLQRATGR
jgi:Phage integrase, N-terminal SAM-like domain